MRIESSSVSMASGRTYKAETETSTTNIMRHYGNDYKQDQVSISVSTAKTKQLEVEGGHVTYAGGPAVTEQPEGQRMNGQTSSSNPADDAALNNALQQASEGKDWLSSISEQIEKDPKLQMLKKALELLSRYTGKNYYRDPFAQLSQSGKRSSQFSFAAASVRYQSVMASAGVQDGALSVNAQGQNGFWTRQTVQSAFVKGEEHTAFSSVGTVKTSDGRTIDFGISVEMSRSFEMAYESVSQEAVYTDPLVINLDTDAAELSDVKMYFDLDGDGRKEEMSGLGGGSGFLALDRNGDGKINDGSELFGAKTGNGFGELAQYDQDGNGWIDENDEVFSKLSVWVKAGSGDAKLISLKDAGVGAIFLGSQATQFTLDDSSGQEGAQIRRSGVYLKENGQAGTVQHVDFKN